MVTPIHRARPTCVWCRRRSVLIPIRGSWRVVKHHDVCRQCWRSFMDGYAAWKLRRNVRAA